MQGYQAAALPWSWEQKVADFQKPGDRVFSLPEQSPAAQALILEAQYDLVLNHGAPCTFEDYRAVFRALKPGGFFLSQQPGGEDCRGLANFLCPGSRPAARENLEAFKQAFQEAGFRVMYRDQAYPVGTFYSLRALETFIRTNPEKFPGVTEEIFHARREALEAILQRDGGIQNEEHVFLLIGKKRS